MNISRLTAAAAITAVAVIAPATSAHAREWHPIEGHAGLVLATCSDGSQVLSAMATDPRRNRYSQEPILDADGNMVGLLLMLKYAGGYVHSTTGQTLLGSGTDRIVLDFVNGTETHTGNRWTVTLAGRGWVIKEAGTITLDLADGAVLQMHGVNDGFDEICSLFGVGA